MSPSSMTSARVVKNSGRIPPVPGEVPVPRLSKASFKPATLSTGCPIVTEAGNSLLLAMYLDFKAAITVGFLVSATPWEVRRETALLTCPLDKWTRAAFLLRRMISSSLLAGLTALLLSVSLLFTSFALSDLKEVMRKPQSPSAAALNLAATSALPRPF